MGATEAVVADLNGDGQPEIIFATFVTGVAGDATAGHLIALSNTGKVILLHFVFLPFVLLLFSSCPPDERGLCPFPLPFLFLLYFFAPPYFFS